MTTPVDKNEAVDISPEAVELTAMTFGAFYSTGTYAVASAQLRALRSALTDAQRENDGLQAACRQWKEQFDAKDAALQQARLSLTARDKQCTDAAWLITNVHYRDDNRRDVWNDIKRMYDEDHAKGETKCEFCDGSGQIPNNSPGAPALPCPACQPGYV